MWSTSGMVASCAKINRISTAGFFCCIICRTFARPSAHLRPARQAMTRGRTDGTGPAGPVATGNLATNAERHHRDGEEGENDNLKMDEGSPSRKIKTSSPEMLLMFSKLAR